MKPIDARKLKMLEDELGSMTSDLALDQAIKAEQTAKDCGAFDPAFEYMKMQQFKLENFAYLLAMAGR